MIDLNHIEKPNRMMAPVSYYGGKGNLARRIVPLLPDATCYVEPYCGAASVFWHLPRPYPIETLNDLSGDIVNLFQVLQDRTLFDEFQHRIVWTPYALDEFRRALAYDGDDPVMRAWAFYVRQNQGFGGTATTEGNWGRSLTTSHRKMAATANKWRGRMTLLETWHDRLTRVQIDHRDALDVIRYWDAETTLFYIDPPYMHETRTKGNLNKYAVEQDDVHHTALIETLLSLKGQAVLSGYDAPLYRQLDDAGWRRVEIQTASYAAGKTRGSGLCGHGAALAKVARTEVIWLKKHETGGRLL